MTKGGARDWYRDGVAGHYAGHGAAYRNPHASIIDDAVAIAIDRWSLDVSSVFDLAAGAGELTLSICSVRPAANVVGADPFTFAAYESQTGQSCERSTFEAIAAGALGERAFSLIGCSFAMHLCPPSVLPTLAIALAQRSTRLLILTPHKRPVLRATWGWRLHDEFVERRVRVRLYESTLHSSPEA